MNGNVTDRTMAATYKYATSCDISAAGCPHHVSANQKYLVQTIGVNEHVQTARNGQIKFQTAIFDKPWLRACRVRKVAGLTAPLHGYLRRRVVPLS